MSKFRITTGLAALAMALPSVAIAPVATADDEMVVVGSRYPVSPDAIGNAVTILDEDYITGRGTILVGDLLRSVPGLAVSTSGPLGYHPTLRRNHGTGATAS